MKAGAAGPSPGLLDKFLPLSGEDWVVVAGDELRLVLSNWTRTTHPGADA